MKISDYDNFKRVADHRDIGSTGEYSRSGKFSVMNFSNGFPGFSNTIRNLYRQDRPSSSLPLPDPEIVNDSENSFLFKYSLSNYSGDFLEELQALSGTGTHIIVLYNNFMAQMLRFILIKNGLMSHMVTSVGMDHPNCDCPIQY